MTPQDEMNELRASIREAHQNILAQGVNIESLHSSMHELFESQARHDAQIEKLTSKLDALTTNVDKLVNTIEKIANIVIAHNGRLDKIDGGPTAT